MWLLSCVNQGGSSYRLTEGKEHYVSRTTGDIILTGDQSVSRKHAVLKVISNDGVDGVTVTDLGSKYGTYINESNKLDSSEPYLLKDGDVIKFGCQWNEWRFDSKPLVVTTSTLPAEVKTSLKNLISEFGGTLVNDWQETCTHLTMTSILLTAKVVCALASAVPIVTPEYWTCFKEAIEQKKLPPEPDKFIPPLKENILNKNKVSFAVNEERRKVFNGKTLVFSTEKQMKKYKTLITAAGGKCIALCDCNWKMEEFCKPDIIVMQNVSNFEPQHEQSVDQYNSVLNFLKSNGIRPIPESEVGLAILMCSLNIYCNPQYNVVSNVLLGGAEVSLSQLKTQEVWAADTQSEASVKIEKSFEEMPTVKREIAIESGPSLLQDSKANSDQIDEMETQPMENYQQNLRSKRGNQMESGITSSRKRMATNDSEEPPPKKTFSDPVNESSSHDNVFDFTDLYEAGLKRRSVVANDDFLESSKRNHVDSEEICNNNQRKKSRLEEALGSKQSNPGCSKYSAITVNSEKNSCISKEVHAGKSSFDKEVTTSNGKCNSKVNGVSSAVKEDFLAVPSTSKLESSKNYIKVEKTERKTGNGNWNSRMTEGILDMAVKMEELVVERSNLQMPESTRHEHSVNFKKFKKVRSSAFKKANLEILGENDLIAC